MYDDLFWFVVVVVVLVVYNNSEYEKDTAVTVLMYDERIYFGSLLFLLCIITVSE